MLQNQYEQLISIVNGQNYKSVSDEKLQSMFINIKQELKSRLKCVVCMDNAYNLICIPCGHTCLCQFCADKTNQICPICRQSVKYYKKIFGLNL